MLIPQGMAYAMIAGLPPIYGLYAALVPLLVYAAFGTSRQLAVGPVAMVSLLVATGVGAVAGADGALYISLAVVLALLVGALQLVLGLARFGFLVNFLSHPVLTGFTSAAALIIGLSQLKHLLGVEIGRTHLVHEIILEAAAQASALHLPTVLLGLSAIVLLIALKRWKKTFPGALAAVAATTVVVWVMNLEVAGVRIVGTVPGGLPSLSLPSVSLAQVGALMPSALAIALVGFMESIAIAKSLAARHRYEVDANQELVGLGLANLVGGLFQSYAVTGGFSRTAVNDQAGARTPMAAVISAAIIALTLLFLTPLFYYMPNAVLAAIVMVAVAGLIDVREIRFLWRVKRPDFAMMAVTFLATLALGIEEGIVVGVVVSLILVVHQSSRPHVARLGRLPGTTTYRNLDRNPEAQAPPGVSILRVDASLYFANSAFFKDLVLSTEREADGVQALVLDLYPVNRIDATALHTLKQLVEHSAERNVRLLVAGTKGPVMDVLHRAGIVELVGLENFFHETHEAVEAATQKIAESITSISAHDPAETIPV
jgi:SulP family sulfate permease